MRKLLMAIPLITIFADIAILLNIPLLREIVVFVFLSFIPGFVILRLLKLKEISLVDIILISVGLSIAFLMIVGLLVNQFYLFLGFSQPLTTVPLTVTISAFTLVVFLIEYKRDLSETWTFEIGFKVRPKTIFFVSLILFLLPLSAIGVLYRNVSLVLLSDAIIAAFCILSIASRKLVPEKLFPFLIFSISIAIMFQVLLTSKYITGWDANLEFYVFRLTQINGHWGFLNANLNDLVPITYNSMLSITLLPAIYSSLTNIQGALIFKVLYPFIFSLIPLTLYRICEKQFGKLIGLISALFFVFTSTAFYGPEPLGLNRQIVGELFLILSVFLLISKTIPVTKRRLLLIIFGVGLAFSHYALAYIYLAMVAILFIVSRVRKRFDHTLNTLTVSLIFVITLSWYAYTLVPGAPLISLTNTIKYTISNMIGGGSGSPSGVASAIFLIPPVFSASTWINVLLIGVANLFLIIGALSIIFRFKGKGISGQFKVILIIAAVILVISLITPSVASILNFTRFYGITLLFLSPCFVFGGLTLLEVIGKTWTKIRRRLRRQIISRSKHIEIGFLLVSIVLGAYFLSQVGFVNRVTGGATYYYGAFFDRNVMSNDSLVKSTLYNTFIPEQDVFSASWLSTHKVETAETFADSLSGSHVLVSYGLIPSKLLIPLSNVTIPSEGSFVYLGSLNVVNGIITSTQGSFNTSEISPILDQNNLIYSNGYSEIWYVNPVH